MPKINNSRTKTLPELEMAELTRQMESGISRSAIAKTFGVSFYWLQRRFGRGDTSRKYKEVVASDGRIEVLRSRTKILPETAMAEISRQIESGVSRRQIAKAFGVSEGWLRNRFGGNADYFVSEKVREELNRRVTAGESREKVASELGVSKSTMSRHAPPGKNKRKSEELIAEIKAAFSNGEKKEHIAKRLGISDSFVHKHTSKTNAPPIPEEQKETLKRRVLGGETVAKVARELGIPQPNAHHATAQVLKNFKLTKANVREINKLRVAGKKAEEIAMLVKVPFASVNKALGVSLKRYPQEIKDKAIALFESGKSSTEISETLGVKAAAALAWFRNAIKAGTAKRVEFIPRHEDLKFDWVVRLDPEFEEWRTYALDWIETSSDVSAAVKGFGNFIEDYLFKQGLQKRPVDLLSSKELLPDFYEVACPKSAHGRRMNKEVHNFIDHVLGTEEFADTSVTPPLRLPHLYRNPVNLIKITNESQSPSESTKTILPYWMITDLRRRIVQGPDFKDWTWVQGLMGRRTLNGQAQAPDWFVVREVQVDRSDPDCVTRLRNREKFDPILEMWSPVRAIATLFCLQVPSRRGQARFVDSGEADTLIYQDGKWVPNLSPLVQGSIRSPRQQGIFRRPSLYDEANGVPVSIYFNSNKTADKAKSGKDMGFVCPWPKFDELADDPYYWLVKLRDFQVKFNPIKKLTRWRDIDPVRKLSTQRKERLDQYPDTAFLFRLIEDTKAVGPLSSNEIESFWCRLMAAYEEILWNEGITHPGGKRIELINPANGNPWSSPHATRVSLITHLIVDGKVPVEIMMKLVGHQRFIMTVYYTKVGLKTIEHAIKDATLKLDEGKDEALLRDLASGDAERIRSRVAFNAEDWEVQFLTNPSDLNPLGWLYLHDGICLAGGNTNNTSLPGCHNGGPLLRKLGKAKSVYGPTPGGSRNCSRCRWKCAGKKHLVGLVSSLNNRQYHLHKAGGEAIEAEKTRNSILKEKASTDAASAPFSRANELRSAERRYEAAMQRMQDLALDLVAINRLIERIAQMPDEHDIGMALVAQGDPVSLQVILEDVDSELLVLAGVCADVEFFPDLDPGTAVFEYYDLIERAFETQGHPLPRARLSEKERLSAANAMMREMERLANPSNPILGRRAVVQVMDRGESLENLLGVQLNNITQAALQHGQPITLRLDQKENADVECDFRAS